MAGVPEELTTGGLTFVPRRGGNLPGSTTSRAAAPAVLKDLKSPWSAMSVHERFPRGSGHRPFADSGDDHRQTIGRKRTHCKKWLVGGGIACRGGRGHCRGEHLMPRIVETAPTWALLCSFL